MQEDPGAEGQTYRCEDNCDRNLEFTKVANDKTGYLINYADGAADCKSETRSILNKMNPLLDCGESDDIFDGHPGIYTWLLCSINDKFIMFFKHTIIANEIRSKHGDIVDDICNETFGENKFSEIIVYYGGEVRITAGPHFTFNMLSGTYSRERVDIDPNDKVKSFLTDFINRRNPVKVKITFDTSGKSFIKPFEGEAKITDKKLLGLMSEGIGLDVYKFDFEDQEAAKLWQEIKKKQNKSILESQRFARQAYFENLNRKIPPSEQDLLDQQKELEKFSSIPDEVMEKYKLTPKDSLPNEPMRKKTKTAKNFRRKGSTRTKYPRYKKVNRKRLAKIFSFT